MKFIRHAKIPDVMIIEPRVFSDPRGFFFENYNRELFSQHGIKEDFVQDNHSFSLKGTLRGLHYQIPPGTQSKLVRVVLGAVFDVVVDLRRKSKTFGQYVSDTLSAENKKMLYVPPGFAHGFLVLEDNTHFLYKVTDFYSPSLERGIAWNDPALGISWPKPDTPFIISEKDKNNPLLKNVSKNDLF
jgi:dTDP-4-dehydrorhamnose 3,5-epimerase